MWSVNFTVFMFYVRETGFQLIFAVDKIVGNWLFVGIIVHVNI